jgi:hypothetical protein
VADGSYGRLAMSRLCLQRGQATVEWVGLMLGVALALGAVVAGGREAAKGESAVGLGEAVAERITCAVRDACAGTTARGRAGQTKPATPDRVRPSPPRAAPPRRPALPGGSRALGHGGSRALGHGATGVAKRAWIVCLAYRRWRHDVEHPPTPRQALPVDDAVDIVNECLNPLSFLFG